MFPSPLFKSALVAVCILRPAINCRKALMNRKDKIKDDFRPENKAMFHIFH